jgi:hypothetical protein
MADERLRIFVDDPYLVALGRCLFVFAGLEWNAVWCGEKISPGFLDAARGKTAGSIAADLEPLAAALPAGTVQARCLAAAQEFRRLVRVRNGIMHAQPCHTRTGEDQLVREGAIWTIPELETAADEFASCSVTLNDLFHHWLP